MKTRAIRIPDALWESAQQVAEERGETVSEAVRRFLERDYRAGPSITDEGWRILQELARLDVARMFEKLDVDVSKEQK